MKISFLIYLILFTTVNCNVCNPDPCNGHGGCYEMPGEGNYVCSCWGGTGWTGTNCDIKIDLCESSPCFGDSICSNGVGYYTYECDCTGTGYSGSRCDILEDICLTGPCMNSGECISTSNGAEYECDCEGTGYGGDHCEFEEACPDDFCQNNSTCVTIADGYSLCNCTDGFTGLTCTEKIDKCYSSPCLNNGECSYDENNFYCNCTDEYQGDICEDNVDKCYSSPCQNDGECSYDPENFYCTCQEDYEGKMCQDRVDKCYSSPCQNDGECSYDPENFYCQCLDRYVGTYCEIYIGISEHSSIIECPCTNGICDEEGECLCYFGFEGPYCEIALPTSETFNIPLEVETKNSGLSNNEITRQLENFLGDISYTPAEQFNVTSYSFNGGEVIIEVNIYPSESKSVSEIINDIYAYIEEYNERTEENKEKVFVSAEILYGLGSIFILICAACVINKFINYKDRESAIKKIKKSLEFNVPR